jgi:Tol biopolymer transport system component
MIGTTLSHYRIIAKLGEGGMGEVYRAEDINLKRHVALKVLPPEVAGSQEKLERFRREAETLAGLDHPNIVTIFSIEHAAVDVPEGEAASPGLRDSKTPRPQDLETPRPSVHFLTMQLVEGKPLADLISADGMSVNRVLKIAISLTEALRVAHDKGVVHRDLKPANVMIDQEGRVKVLDFGLAKLRRTDFDEGTSLMATEAMTQEGVILGTIPYMSPEQIQGEAVDHRTDIFSLGIMLHEMLCGERPFKAPNTAALMSSMLRDAPTPVREVKPDLPEKLDLILQRCLERDPLLRYQSADQIWLELRDVQNKIGGSASEEIEAAVERVLAKVPTGQLPISTPEVEVPAAPSEASPRRQSRWYYWLAALGMLWGMVFAVYYLFFDRRRGDESRAPVAAQLSHKQLTSQPGVEQTPSLSPDGQWIVYSGQGPEHQDIFLQSVGGQTPFNLTEDSGADNLQPAFSPNGERIAFRSSREGGGLFVMGRTGEAVRRVTREGFNPAWSPDGTRLVYSAESVGLNPLNWEGRSSIWVAEVETGESHALVEDEGVEPSWSPGGQRIAFVSRLGDRTQMDIVTIPVDGGEIVPVTTDPATDWGPVWSPDGRHLYFASDRSGSMNLWRIAVDEESGEAVGEPEALTTPATYLVHPAISADSHLTAYSSVLMTQNIQKLALEPGAAISAGDSSWITSGSIQWSSVDVSSDGEWLVFYSRARPEGDLYVARTDGSGLRQLTGDEAMDRVPRWSPDGEWAAFFSDRSGTLQIWKVRRDGSDLRQLTEADPGASLLAWSPDGSRIAAMNSLGKSARTIIIDPNRSWTEQTPQVLPGVEDSGPPMVVTSWSPDGSMLAGQAGYPGTGVTVFSFETESYQRLTDFGEWPVWLPDSRRLMFVFEGKRFFIVDRESKETQEIFSVPRDVIGPPRISGDGSQVVFSRRVTEADIWLLTFGNE